MGVFCRRPWAGIRPRAGPHVKPAALFGYKSLRCPYWWLLGPGLFSGGFALFTMYVPSLFPTLLRTTGAGFCYNIGRIVSAAGVVFFGLFQQVGDYRRTLLYAGFLFLPAAVIAWRSLPG